MQAVGKKKPDADEPNKKPRYPSRENTRYVAVPVDLHAALERYAKSKSDQDDQKTITWAARVAIRRFLESQGFWPPPAEQEGNAP